MSALTNAFMQSGIGRWFFGREPMERWVIAGLAVLVVGTLLWLIAWRPVAEWHDRALNRMSNAQETLDYVKANQSAARGLGGSQSARGSLINLVSRAAKAKGLVLNRLQPEDSGLLNVVLQGQPFDDVFEWMATLERNNGVRVRQASFQAEERQGYVNAQIRFE